MAFENIVEKRKMLLTTFYLFLQYFPLCRLHFSTLGQKLFCRLQMLLIRAILFSVKQLTVIPSTLNYSQLYRKILTGLMSLYSVYLTAAKSVGQDKTASKCKLILLLTLSKHSQILWSRSTK